METGPKNDRKRKISRKILDENWKKWQIELFSIEYTYLKTCNLPQTPSFPRDVYMFVVCIDNQSFDITHHQHDELDYEEINTKFWICLPQNYEINRNT